MSYLELPYYVGLLTAAQHYGAAHQQPQQFHVVTNQYLRSIRCGRIYIVFIKNENCKIVPTRKFNTQTGYIQVAAPEATMLDLIRYPLRVGGINNIATVLIELSESINSNELSTLLDSLKPEVVLLQRLGYLLDLIQQKKLALIVTNYLKQFTLSARPLVAGISCKNALRNKKWELYINYKVEPDL